MRIQKYLSQQDICSRRQAEAWLQKGYISVNGQVVTELGIQVSDDDDIQISPKAFATQHSTIKLYKPRGIITNCAKPGERQITDILPKHLAHLNAVGRLDKDSEGLILLTSDGVLSKKLLSQETPHERVYEVWVNNPIGLSQIRTLESGILLFGKKTKPLTIKKLGPKHVQMQMIEGKNRQIRRMMRHVGLTVTRLKRLRFGVITLGQLAPGEWELIPPDRFGKYR